MYRYDIKYSILLYMYGGFAKDDHYLAAANQVQPLFCKHEKRKSLIKHNLHWPLVKAT